MRQITKILYSNTLVTTLPKLMTLLIFVSFFGLSFQYNKYTVQLERAERMNVHTQENRINKMAENLKIELTLSQNTTRMNIESLAMILNGGKNDNEIMNIKDLVAQFPPEIPPNSNLTTALIQGRNLNSLHTERGRILTIGPNCLVYDPDDENICLSCDEDNGYYLYLRNKTHIMCAYSDTSMVADGWGQWCVTEWADYPYEPSLYYGSLYTSGTGVLYCIRYDWYNYDAASESFVCDAIPILYEITDIYLSTVYTRSTVYCLQCTFSPWTNAYVRYIDSVGVYTGECSEETYQCAYTEYYDSDQEECVACTETYGNCAACNATDCIMCLENYYWNPSVFNYDTGEYEGKCIFDTCPVGYCKSVQQSICVESTIDNCLKCVDDNELTQEQYCQYCEGGYYLAWWDDNLCYAPYYESIEVVLFVTSDVPINVDLVNDLDLYTYSNSQSKYYLDSPYGYTPSEPSISLIDCLGRVLYNNQYDYAYTNATIYVGKGEHFLFVCDGDEYILFYGKDDTELLAQYCNQYSWWFTYRQDFFADNFTITIEALDCAYADVLGYTGDTDFFNLCVDFAAGEEKPTIFVNSPKSYFNISGNYTFKNLKFSGINNMASPKVNGYAIYSVPIQLCDILEEPNGMEGTIKLQTIDNSDIIDFEYNCEDPYYTGSYIASNYTTDSQCKDNSYKQFSTSQSSTLSCPGVPTDDEYFLQSLDLYAYFKRRYTLFNMYAYGEHTTMSNSIPQLHIIDCDFEYFLKGYESLINVETNSFMRTNAYNYKYEGYYETSNETRGYYFYNQGDRGAKINITGSTFKHSRFCKGMIIYRKAPYDGTSLSLVNLTHLYMSTSTKQDSGSYIYIYNSQFTNLNAFTNVTAFAIYGGTEVFLDMSDNSFEPVKIPAMMHKGIVLNVEDFNGRIEIISCTFEKNFHFVPDIYYNYHLLSDTLSDLLFKDTTTTLEYQLSTCDPTSFYDIYFFNKGFRMDDDLDQFFDDFERLGLIYIARNKQITIIKDNYFSKNIGTFGGAITINSPDWATGVQPYVVIYNNEFERNMAYFSGNAIYIRNTLNEDDLNLTCAGTIIHQNQFTNNVGMKIHNGGAISAYCQYISSTYHQDYLYTSGYSNYMNKADRTDLPTMYITTVVDSAKIKIDRFKFSVKHNGFTQNFSGMKGTAVYIRQMSDIIVYNCTFLLNGPNTAVMEYYYSPYTAYLSQRSTSYYDEDCFDELEYLERCNNIENSYIDFPRVQGALHVIFCQESSCLTTNNTQSLEISSCEFLKNEAGPILEDRYQNTEATASQIHIVGGFSNLIQECNFYDNKGTTYFYTNMKTSNISDYFPEGYQYFLNSMSSLINIYLDPVNPLDFIYLNTTIIDSIFYRNKNTQVTGLTTFQEYKGSLIKIINYATSVSSVLPILNIQSCDFRENIFIGDESSLIYSSNAILTITKSMFQNNGYISTSTYSKSTSDVDIDSTQFYFSDYIYEKSQYYGIVFIEGDLAMALNYTHQFTKNTFSFNFASYGTAFTLGLDDQQAYLYGNKYQYMFAKEEGSLLYGYSTSARSTILMDNEDVNYMFAQSKGAVVIEPSKDDLMNLYVRNSIFDNLQAEEGQAFYLLQAAKVTFNNITLNRTKWHKSNSDYVQSQFVKNKWTLTEFTDLALFKQLLNKVELLRGYFYLKNVLNTQKVEFQGKTLYNASYKYISYVEIINSRIQNGYSKESSIMDSSTSNVRVSNTYGTTSKNFIKNNTGTFTGCFSMLYTSDFVAENLLFLNNTSDYKANSLIMSGSTATFVNVTFQENYSTYMGTILVESNSGFQCTYCYFIHNHAYDTSTIFAYNNMDSIVTIDKSIFLNNTSTSNLINYLYSKGTITNTTFIDNISEKVNNGFTLVNSQVNMTNIIVNFTDYDFLYNNDYNVDTGFFNLNYQSQIIIESSILQNSRGAIGALMYATGSSVVYIKNNTLIKNVQSRTGSVIYATMTELVQISNTTFLSNSQRDIFLDQTEGQIYNSYFSVGEQQFIYAQTSMVTIYNNKFLDGHNTNIAGKALYCDCLFINATNNLFQNLSAVQGGALFFYSTTTTANFTIKKNSFINNTAQQGGAIYIQDSAYLDLINNQFTRNYAEVIYPKTLESSKLSEKGLGGAIYYACSNDDIKENGGCIVNLKTKNDFLSNYAENDGGAIIWISNPFIDDDTTIYRNNTAYYGNDLASYPKKIYVEILNNNDYLYPYNASNSSTANNSRILLTESNYTSYIPTFVSGTAFQFNVYILDQNGNIYNTDSSSKATFKYTGSDRVVVTGNEIIAKEGVYYFTNVEVAAPPGSELNFKIEISGIQTYDNDIEFVDTPINFNITLRSCTQGESYTSDYRCDVCEEDTYLYFAPTTFTQCKICDANAICFGAQVVAPKSGYWRSSNTSENFISCPNSAACLAGDKENPQGICSTGYTDILCGNCDDNYSKTAQFECSACPERTRNIVQITFIMIAAVAYVAFVVRSTLNSSAQDKPMHSVYLKIMTNHFQVLSAISNIDYQWPDQIQTFTDSQNEVTSVSDQVFSFDCFLMSSSGKDDGIIPIYYQKLLGYGFMPILLALFDFLFWTILGTIRKRDYSNLRSNFTSTLVVLLFLVHPNIAKAMFLSFNCLDVDGTFRLKENIASVCYKSEHLTYIMAISTPSVVLWCLGIPFFAFILLRANKNSLLLQDRSVITESENERVKIVKMKYGFIFLGYKGSAYFWEVLLMYRKVGIIMATVFLSTLSNEAQVLAVMIIIVISMLLQIRYEPYQTKILNKMEMYSLQVAGITLYAGMYYITGTHYSYMDNDGLSWFFLIFIVSPNAVFFAYWGYYMRIEVLKIVHKKNKPRLFKIVACQTSEAFYEKYMKNDPTVAAAQQIIPDDQVKKQEEDEDEIIKKKDFDDDFENEEKGTKNSNQDDSIVDVAEVNLEPVISQEIEEEEKEQSQQQYSEENYHTNERLKESKQQKQKHHKVYPETQVKKKDSSKMLKDDEDSVSNDSDNGEQKENYTGKNSPQQNNEPRQKKVKSYQQKLFDKIRILKKNKLRDKRYQDNDEADPNDVKLQKPKKFNTVKTKPKESQFPSTRKFLRKDDKVKFDNYQETFQDNI